MKKDPTTFRERFKEWKEGKDPYRYLYDDQNGNWSRITADENADAFANFVATPNGSRPTFSMYENTPNPKLPTNKNATFIPDNTLWTRQQVEKANNTRTWRSDVADVMHSIGEGAMLASTFAAPEVEPLVNPAYQAIKGIVTNATRSNASKILANPRNFQFAIPEIPYEIQNIPGYQLKTLMRGNQLEKQLSKNGTISVNSVRAQADKASDVEKYIIDNVLSKKFAGQKSVDYNDFRQAVHDDLITYKRISDNRFDDYGIDRLGISTNPKFEDDPALVDTYNNIIGRLHDFELQHVIPRRTRNTTPEQLAVIEQWRNSVEGRQYDDMRRELDSFIRQHPGFSTVGGIQGNIRRKLVGHSGDGAELNTYTFTSDVIPKGNNRHYDSNTLGHSRTYTTADEPEVLHVMESQSDWGQAKLDPIEYYKIDSSYDDQMSHIEWIHGDPYDTRTGNLINFDKLEEDAGAHVNIKQIKHLHDNYLIRQLQENLKYAAERAQSKMRYPTSETAAKIEGYQKGFGTSEELERLRKQIRDTQTEFEKAIKLQKDPFIDSPEKQRVDDLENKLKTLRAEFDEALIRAPKDYSPEHKTILKKYADFPKLYKKLYKDADVRTITDSKGHTWYEVDVPKDYLNQEWKYNFGKDLFKRIISRPKLKF